jgi:hypothetical protein
VLRRGKGRTEHLDRVAWSTGVSVDAYGMLVGLRTSDRAASSALHRVIPPGSRLSDEREVDALFSVVVGDDRRTHVLYEDAERTAHSTDLDELLDTLQSQLHFRVASCARTHLFVHAGVVGWRGGAILIPGRTHSGKSSLVAALVRAGATYYSDEYAVLDDAGLVHPFARPLGIRDASGRTQPVQPASLGAAIGDAPIPVRMVIATRYVAGDRGTAPALWELRPMSPGETVLALLENTLAAQSRPADALRILCAAASGVTSLHGPRGDAGPMATRILELCSTFLP